MSKRILINALYPEEKRVAIVEGDRLVDFYVEVSSREHLNLKGNIYKGVVARVEPGLQAAFVDFGPKKHGFLQVREIQPEYFSKGKDKREGKRHRIQDVLSKGQELMVQIEKDERDTKGASLTTYLSLPGRYIVMMPGQERMIGISRKIEGREDRERLKGLFSSLKLPKDIGFILRTASGDTTSEELDNDLKYLTKLWTKIKTDAKKAPAPALIYKEQDIAVKTVRDYLTSDVVEVLIDDAEAYRKTRDFLKKTMPGRKLNIKHYREKQPIFSLHAIEEQIAKVNERFVSLPSQGYLVFDRAEALTAIDVNSGRSRKEENVEATAYKTNLEAADEVARQLRLRDIGGLIIIDFIDMEPAKNRREVERRFRHALSTDKAHVDITSISKFGIVEMTRERLRTAYADSMNRSCPLCGGAGLLKSDDSIAIAALRDMHSRASAPTADGVLKGLTCRLPVESANYLVNNKRSDILELEKTFDIKIAVVGDAKFLPGQFSVDAEVLKDGPRVEVCPPPPQQPQQQEARTDGKGRGRRGRRGGRGQRGPGEQKEQKEQREEEAPQEPVEQSIEQEHSEQTRSADADASAEASAQAEASGQAAPGAKPSSRRRRRRPRSRRDKAAQQPGAAQSPAAAEEPGAGRPAQEASEPAVVDNHQDR